MSLLVRHEKIGPEAAPHRIRIAHLSDFHLWFSERKLRAIERILAAWQPDVLALTGDYADTRLGRRIALRWIERMAANFPLCWIAGNHDHWGGRGFVRELEALGAAHAIDRADAWIVPASGGRFRCTTFERYRAALARGCHDEPTIILLHDPAAIVAEDLRRADRSLLLAGHLHGGQITLWRDRTGRPQPAAWCYRWLVERATVGQAELIVSRGLGDLLPLRIGVPKEVVMVDFAA